MGMNTRYVKEYFYKKKIRSMFVWNLEIIAVILLAAAFSWFFCRSVVVQEGSMEPTFLQQTITSRDMVLLAVGAAISI